MKSVGYGLSRVRGARDLQSSDILHLKEPPDYNYIIVSRIFYNGHFYENIDRIVSICGEFDLAYLKLFLRKDHFLVCAGVWWEENNKTHYRTFTNGNIKDYI